MWHNIYLSGNKWAAIKGAFVNRVNLFAHASAKRVGRFTRVPGTIGNV